MSESNFQRARSRFESRKRKPSYPESRDSDYHRSSGSRRDRSRERDRDGADDRSRGSGSRRPRSRSPPRWERGKKQKQKTQTDVPPDRELFVGNIPANIDDRFLLNFLNGAMRQVNLCAKHETPCLSCQINAGNFAFVEMVTPDMANRCLNLNGILFLNARIKVGRPKKYSGPFVVTKTWQELTGESLTVDAVLDSEAEKVNRELFVGNTTPEMTDQMLSDFLGTAMEQVGLNVMDGNPITSCEMFGKYAFIELRTPREATYALCLNNIPFMGSNLQITRPSKWQGKWEQHCNWEHVLARFNMKPEEFQLGQIISPAVIAATPTEPIDGENINVVKAELAQVKRALEITRRQLEESNKKSEARKEQLVSLNKKWAEGKTELSEKKHELYKVKEELSKKRVSVHDMDTMLETQDLKKKHEETQGMLRGVTESLVKATERLAHERKIRRDLEKLMQESMSTGLSLNLNLEEGEEPDRNRQSSAAETSASMSIDFASIRQEMAQIKTEPEAMEEDGDGNASIGPEDLKTPKASTSMDENEAPRMESLRSFLSTTPSTPIDWTAGALVAPAETPRTRDRGGVRLCRLLVTAPDMDAKDIADVTAMAAKYNLGGYAKGGKPGLVVVEGLEFNCDIFLDNILSAKKKFNKSGKVSERSGRAFPKELTKLEGENALSDFKKACESVGLKDSLEKVVGD